MAQRKKRTVKSKSGRKPSRRKPARKAGKPRTAAKPTRKARRSPVVATMSEAPVRRFRAVCREGDFRGTITTNPDVAHRQAQAHMIANESHVCEVIVRQ